MYRPNYHFVLTNEIIGLDLCFAYPNSINLAHPLR